MTELDERYIGILGVIFTYYNGSIYIYDYRYGTAREENPQLVKKYIESFDNLIIPEEYVSYGVSSIPKNGKTYNGVIHLLDENNCELFVSTYIDPDFGSKDLRNFICDITGSERKEYDMY